MDYPFYTAPISKIPQHLIDMVAAHVSEVAFDTYGYLDTLQHTEKQKLPKVIWDACQEMVKHLSWLPEANVASLAFTRIAPKTTVVEHSDMVSRNGTIMTNTVLFHKIHVPIITNTSCLTHHRRTKREGFQSFYMPTGYAYAYNDYTWHKVTNDSDVDRYHLIIRYRDPTLALKLSILNMLKLDPSDFYEAVNYTYPFKP